MIETRFDRSCGLIVVEASLQGPLGPIILSLAVDTGSTETVVTPWVVDELGYSPRDGEQITRVRSAVGEEQGYTLRVESFAALGYRRRGFRVHVFDLAAGYGIDGLVGLSFLDAFNYEVRSRDATLRVSEV